MRRTDKEERRIIDAFRAELQRAHDAEEWDAPIRQRVADRLGIPLRTLSYRVRAWGLGTAILDCEREIGWRSWGPGRRG